MSTTTITGLPDATTPLTGNERVPMDQAGTTKDATTQDIADLAGAAIAAAIATHDDEADPHNGASPTFADLTLTGLLTAPHIHGSLAGDIYLHVKNTSGGSLAANTAVYATGSVGDTDRIEVAACDPTDPAKMPAIGLLTTTLANNGTGDAIILGELRPTNTGSYTLGDELYVGAGGALVNTIPASGTVQRVGSVARVQSETGTIVVGIGAGMSRVGFTGAYGDLSGTPAIPSAADATPQPLGVAAIGASADYAREDHVHVMPSAADVGADAAGAAASAVSTHEAASDPHPGYALETSLGNAAALDVGTTAGTVAAGDDARFAVQDIYITTCSDETTALTTGTAKVTFRMPAAGTLTAVKATVTTAPAGSDLIVDINEAGTSVLSTKLSIDDGEKTSETAATPPVISDSALADDAEITIDIDQVGSDPAGAGLKITLYVSRS